MPSYTTMHTQYGLNRIAASLASGLPINLTHFAVGDGNGGVTTPSLVQTALVHETWRTTINRITVDPTNPSYLFIEGVIPFDVGGWTIREVGIFDDAGHLFTVGQFPDTYKSVPTDGASNDLVVRIEVFLANTAVISLVIDPAVAIATQAWVVSNVTIGSVAPGGTTGQVLTKQSNTSGDAIWLPPSTASVTVNANEESQIAASGQATFTLAALTTLGLGVYKNGFRLPKRTGAGGWQQGTGITQVVLGTPCTAGDEVTFIQQDSLGLLPQLLESSLNLSDLASIITARANLGVYSKAETDSKVPAGTIIWSARTTATPGWLVADGSPLLVANPDYANLFAAIGHLYDNGSTFVGPPDPLYFYLPDLRGLFVRGIDLGRGLDVGRTMGESWPGYQLDSFRSHQHTVPRDNRTPVTSDGVGAGSESGGTPDNFGISDGGYSFKTVSASDGGGAETRPKNIALLPLIKL